MWQEGSPEPMENSSGYVSNSTSMNQPVKYATIGRNKPGGVKRTSSLLVTQPQVPGNFKPNPIPKPKRAYPQKDIRKQYKNELSRPSSRTSKSSLNSGSGVRRPASRASRDTPTNKMTPRRTASRTSHSKIRRPDSRTSSKALIMRRRESTRRTTPVKRSTSIKSSSRSQQRKEEEGGSRPGSRGSHRHTQPKHSESKSFFSWRPKLTLKRSKSLHAKNGDSKKREIRFGDEAQPGVIMMKGVEHRKVESGTIDRRAADVAAERAEIIHNEVYVPAMEMSTPSRVSQTLPRQPKKSDSPSRSKRACSVDLLEHPAPIHESPLESSPSRQRRHQPLRPTRSVSPHKPRPPSELSSSPAPRAPIWRASSEGSLSDTITNLSAISVSREERRRHHQTRSTRPRGTSEEKSSRSKKEPEKSSSVMDFIRRKLSIKPKEKPKPLPIKRHERASSSSTSSPERPARVNNLKPAKSHEVLTAEENHKESHEKDKKRYRSLPRGKHKSSTTLSRRLSSMGWGTIGRSNVGKSRSFKEERSYESRNNLRGETNNAPKNNERLERRNNHHADMAHPPIPPKAVNENTKGRPRDDTFEEPIKPIIQERRALSQPSLFFPRDGPEPPEEPFTHYANIPFQLPPRRPASPGPSAVQGVPPVAPVSKRAMSQPSLLAPRPPSPLSRSSAERSTTIYAYSPHHRTEPPKPRTKTVWRPTITVKRKGILKRGRSVEPDGSVKNVNVTKDHGQQQQKQPGVLHGIAHNIKNAFKHRRNGDDKVPEGYVAVPGGAVVSERFTNITNTHEEKENVLEEEEVHHLGDYTNEEVSRTVREGGDARALVRHREHSASGHAGQLVDPRADGRRRVVHQSGTTWRTVDTEDIHEKSHQDKSGELITETARTTQREEFGNVEVPDDGSDMRDGSVHEEVHSSARNRRHTKDVDMLEYYSMPRGGRLGDGIKLGEGLRYVQENVEEDREGEENIESLSERMRKLRQLGYKPAGGAALAKSPIEYQEEEKTRRKETHKWLESHFGSESGQSQSSDDGRDEPSRRHGKEETDRRREYSSYEHRTSSGVTKKGSAPPASWEKSEKYSKEVRQTPENTYIKEVREGPRGGFERVEVVPTSSPRAIGHFSSKAPADKQSETEEDPIFSSKFSSGKPRGVGVRFNRYHQESSGQEQHGWPDSGRLSPPTESPPPPPPPRHKRKNRDQQSPQRQPPPVNHYASSPIRERYDRNSREDREYQRQVRESFETSATSSSRHQAQQRDITPSRHDPGQASPQRRHERVKEYHFKSGEVPAERREYRDTPASPHRSSRHHGPRESPGRPTYYLGQAPATGRSPGRDRSLSTDQLDGRYRSSREQVQHQSSHSHSRREERDRVSPRYHKSSDQLDRRSAEEPRSLTADRRYLQARYESSDPRSQTLPRKPRDAPASPHLADSTRFGGSMINVSVKNNVMSTPTPPPKPARAPVKRSNSLYSKEAIASRHHSGDTYSGIGLKSPDIISKIQRTASMRRESGGDGASDPHGSRYRFEESSSLRRNTGSEVRSSSMTSSSASAQLSRSPDIKSPPQVAPKPRPAEAKKDNFMRGLMKNAPELYSVLHGDERKDSKTPSPKQSPPMTPPPPLQRARSPASPVPPGKLSSSSSSSRYPREPPVFRRIERLRADEEVVTKDGRSRSATPPEDLRNLRIPPSGGGRADVVKVQR